MKPVRFPNPLDEVTFKSVGKPDYIEANLIRATCTYCPTTEDPAESTPKLLKKSPKCWLLCLVPILLPDPLLEAFCSAPPSFPFVEAGVPLTIHDSRQAPTALYYINSFPHQVGVRFMGNLIAKVGRSHFLRRISFF